MTDVQHAEMVLIHQDEKALAALQHMVDQEYHKDQDEPAAKLLDWLE